MGRRSRIGELEQAVLDALWVLGGDRGGVTGREVHERLADRELAYTTVMTVLDRLVRKDVLVRRRDGRSFRYQPRRTRAEMTAHLMMDALDGLGADREQALLSFVTDASKDDLDALRRALDELP